jgi:two-component system, OmpR family, sensor histidine kinase SenX3
VNVLWAGERRAYTPSMDAGAVVAIAAGVAVVAVAGGVVAGRLSRQADIEEAHREAREAAEAMRRGERSSREERQVQDLILGSMQEGVLLFDADGRSAFANAALVRHLGTDPDSTGQLFPVALRHAVARTVESAEPTVVDVEVGSPARWLRVRTTPADDEGSVLLVVSDITESRRIESVRRDFVANASHELKTPAASIQAAAETLRSATETDPNAVHRFATQLEREALRLSRIVADLLDLSRLESGSELGERVRVDVLIREECERYQEQARESGVDLRVAAPAASAVSGSARDLSLLVRNLIDNAIRYTRPGGRVDIETSENGKGDVLLTVRDTGLGIPVRDLPRVFERFYRVDRARSRETGGTGLGLAIVKHVAENHGGWVDVVSELGQGSTFTVTLPAARPA